mgnify:FL=1
MNGEIRRSKIENILKSSAVPVPGVTLAKDLDVSRQIIVSDIASSSCKWPDDPFHKQRLYDSKINPSASGYLK